MRVAALGPRWRSGAHSGELAALATTGVESLHDYVARYLPQLVLSVLIPLVMLGYLFTADLTSAIIVAVTLPLIPLFMALVGWYTDRQTRAKWQALARLAGHFSDVDRRAAHAQGVRSGAGPGGGRAAGDRGLPEGVDGHAAGGVPVLDGARAAGVAVGGARRRGDRPAPGLRRADARGRARRPDSRARRRTCRCASSAPSSTRPRTARRPARRCWPAGYARSRLLGTRTDVPALPGLWLDGRARSASRGSAARSDRSTWRFRAGRITVVTGPSGAGKTTLLQLLAGSQRPDAGSVSVTGDAGTVVPLADDLAGAVALPGRVGRRRAPCSRPARSARTSCWAAIPDERATTTGCASVLADLGLAGAGRRLPRGWRHRLGEAGAGLSQGQRQRLSLARALARDAPVSAPRRADRGAGRGDRAARAGRDPRSATAGRTVVLVTHRAAPLEIADHVVRLAPTGPPPDRRRAIAPDDRLSAVGPW